MTYMFEVYYRPPADPQKEAALLERVVGFGGRFDYREEPENSGNFPWVVLTYEFDELERAEVAAAYLRRSGERLDGPQDYGP